MTKRLHIPAALAAVVLATGCKDHCGERKVCAASHDAGVVDATTCPTDLDPSQPCPPGCEEVPQFC